jgi:UDP-3-O-[3-hydroxymyristoyl] N-acetylglucosamine deacetylase/3-hydroxyacyl-[acyl-carrier-protein] dehydratase
MTMLQAEADTSVDLEPRQRSLAAAVVVSGRGLLGGEMAEVRIEPAPADSGILFERADLDPPVRIPAVVDHAVSLARRTTLRSGETSIDTVEHCLSALAGLGIDNAVIRLRGPELPCGDGSALPFVDAMLDAGIVELDAPRRVFRVREPIVIEEGGGSIAALPTSKPGLQVVYELDYADRSDRIGRQTLSYDPNRLDYRREIAPARTFSLKEEAEALQAQGLGTHLSPKDVLVIGEDGPIENAFRFEDEPVRHKVLDVLGDLSLVGRPLQARIVAGRSGHALNRRLAMRLREQIRAAEHADLLSTTSVMDARSILRLMPHRYPMLLVDRVIEIDGDRRAVGIKNVTINEPFFEGHYPGTPIMPGVLLVEALAQMGGLLLSRKLEHTGKIAVLLSLDKVKLRKPVTPGDQVVLEVEALRGTTRTGSVRARALVADRVAAEARIRFMLVDPDQR